MDNGFSPESAYLYLTHETPTAIAQGKHIYGKDEIVSTIQNFDADEKPDENAELLADVHAVVDGEMSVTNLLDKVPKRLHMIGNIKHSIGIMYYEKYGRPYDPISPPRQMPYREQPRPIPQPPKQTDMIPITNKKELDNMPF